MRSDKLRFSFAQWSSKGRVTSPLRTGSGSRPEMCHHCSPLPCLQVLTLLKEVNTLQTECGQAQRWASAVPLDSSRLFSPITVFLGGLPGLIPILFLQFPARESNSEGRGGCSQFVKFWFLSTFFLGSGSPWYCLISFSLPPQTSHYRTWADKFVPGCAFGSLLLSQEFWGCIPWLLLEIDFLMILVFLFPYPNISSSLKIMNCLLSSWLNIYYELRHVIDTWNEQMSKITAEIIYN